MESQSKIPWFVFAFYQIPWFSPEIFQLSLNSLIFPDLALYFNFSSINLHNKYGSNRVNDEQFVDTVA